jgi:hypothetical protein
MFRVIIEHVYQTLRAFRAATRTGIGSRKDSGQERQAGPSVLTYTHCHASPVRCVPISVLWCTVQPKMFRLVWADDDVTARASLPEKTRRKLQTPHM